MDNVTEKSSFHLCTLVIGGRSPATEKLPLAPSLASFGRQSISHDTAKSHRTLLLATKAAKQVGPRQDGAARTGYG